MSMLNQVKPAATQKVLPKKGTYSARIIKFYNLGEHNREWQGKKLQPTNKLYIAFEIPKQKYVFAEEKGEQMMLISKTVNFSIRPIGKDYQSPFSDLLEALGGEDEYIKLYSHITTMVTTESELQEALNNYIQKFDTCQITISHTESEKNGLIYDNISNFTQLSEEIIVDDRENQLAVFDFYKNFKKLDSLPEWQQKQIKESNTWRDRNFKASETKVEQKSETLPEVNVDELNVQMPF